MKAPVYYTVAVCSLKAHQDQKQGDACESHSACTESWDKNRSSTMSEVLTTV